MTNLREPDFHRIPNLTNPVVFWNGREIEWTYIVEVKFLPNPRYRSQLIPWLISLFIPIHRRRSGKWVEVQLHGHRLAFYDHLERLEDYLPKEIIPLARYFQWLRLDCRSSRMEMAAESESDPRKFELTWNSAYKEPSKKWNGVLYKELLVWRTFCIRIFSYRGPFV